MQGPRDFALGSLLFLGRRQSNPLIAYRSGLLCGFVFSDKMLRVDIILTVSKQKRHSAGASFFSLICLTNEKFWTSQFFLKISSFLTSKNAALPVLSELALAQNFISMIYFFSP